MRRTLLVLCLFVGGCGDFSQEDLLFYAAMPSRNSVELKPASEDELVPGDDGQALTQGCDDGDLRCQARGIARGFNGLTFGLLDAIDAITALPPTTRTSNRRVWGPHFVSDQHVTFRFEMQRHDDVFSLCLHRATGEIPAFADTDISCDTGADDETGLVRVFSGEVVLSGSSAKAGHGQLVVHAARADDLAQLAQTLTIDFDANDDDKRTIDVTLTGMPIRGSRVTRDGAYHYERDTTGAGRFFFTAYNNVINEVFDDGIERVDISAVWLSDQSGRADARVSEGDTPPNSDVSVHQCWDAAFVDVYRAPFGEPATGDPALCVVEP